MVGAQPASSQSVPYDNRVFDVPADVSGHELDDGEGTESFAITIVLTPSTKTPPASVSSGTTKTTSLDRHRAQQCVSTGIG